MKNITCLLITCSFSLMMALGFAFFSHAAEAKRYTRMAAIGDIRIQGSGYIISEDNAEPYLAPMPNEYYSDYCDRVTPVSRMEFALRKQAAEDAFLLSPSGGLNREILQIVYGTETESGCIHVSKANDVGNQQIEAVLRKCFSKSGGQETVACNATDSLMTTLAVSP